MSLVWSIFRQCFFIPAPTLTADNLPDQAGRVFIVTGGYAGCGKELSKVLYQRNGTVYVAGRSAEKAKSAIEEIRAAHPQSDGRLEFLEVDLADLPSVKKGAEDFLRREQRLDVLTNNAGVMMPPHGSKSAQGHELQMGTNVLGPWLFTELLTPLLEKTAASSPAGSVRVTWAASLAIFGSPKTGATFTPQNQPTTLGSPTDNYAQSKASNLLLSQAYAKHHPISKTKISTVAWNPGNLNSELQRHISGLMLWVARTISHPVYLGGLTELWAGWGEECGLEANQGKFVGPWGRFCGVRADLEEGRNAAEKVWEWCQREAGEYLK